MGGDSLKCSVCQKAQTDIVYCPVDMTEEQRTTISSIWGVDPDSDFVVCEECMRGHCGAVPGLNGDNWLEERAAENAARQRKRHR